MTKQDYSELCKLIVKLYRRIKNKPHECRCIGIALHQISPAQAMWEKHVTVRSDGSVSWYDGSLMTVSEFMEA